MVPVSPRLAGRLGPPVWREGGERGDPREERRGEEEQRRGEGEQRRQRRRRDSEGEDLEMEEESKVRGHPACSCEKISCGTWL